MAGWDSDGMDGGDELTLSQCWLCVMQCLLSSGKSALRPPVIDGVPAQRKPRGRGEVREGLPCCGFPSGLPGGPVFPEVGPEQVGMCVKGVWGHASEAAFPPGDRSPQGMCLHADVLSAPRTAVVVSGRPRQTGSSEWGLGLRIFRKGHVSCGS